MLVGLRERAAGCAGGCRQRCARIRHSAESCCRHVWPRHLDNSAVGSGSGRIRSGNRHAFGHRAELPQHDRRAAFDGADRDADQQRLRTVDFDCRLREWSLSADEQLHREPGSKLQLHNQRAIRSHGGGRTERHAVHLRHNALTAADGDSQRHRSRSAGVEREPGQPHFYGAGGGPVQP